MLEGGILDTSYLSVAARRVNSTRRGTQDAPASSSCPPVWESRATRRRAASGAGGRWVAHTCIQQQQQQHVCAMLTHLLVVLLVSLTFATASLPVPLSQSSPLSSAVGGAYTLHTSRELKGRRAQWCGSPSAFEVLKTVPDHCGEAFIRAEGVSDYPVIKAGSATCPIPCAVPNAVEGNCSFSMKIIKGDESIFATKPSISYETGGLRVSLTPQPSVRTRVVTTVWNVTLAPSWAGGGADVINLLPIHIFPPSCLSGGASCSPLGVYAGNAAEQSCSSQLAPVYAVTVRLTGVPLRADVSSTTIEVPLPTWRALACDVVLA